MAPIAKVWLVTLNEGRSVIETAFSGVWNEIIVTTAQYATEQGAHHALYQCAEDPGLLLVLAGYPSLDSSLDTRKTGEKLISRVMEFITHKELFLVESDVKEFPIASEKISVLFSESQPADSDSLPGTGKWGAPFSSFLVEYEDGDPILAKKNTWIHMADSEDAGRLSQAGNIKNFTKVVESHTAAQPI